jgi:hypothetical protein
MTGLCKIVLTQFAPKAFQAVLPSSATLESFVQNRITVRESGELGFENRASPLESAECGQTVYYFS